MLPQILLSSFIAFAGPIETGTLGGATNPGEADESYKLDVVLIRNTSRLNRISMWLEYLCGDGSCNGDDELYWLVYEEGPANDWNLVWGSPLVPTGATGGFVDSPPVDFVLEGGKRYALGVQFSQGNYDYWSEDPHPNQDYGWGVMQGSVWVAGNGWDPDSLGLRDPIPNFPPDTHGYLMEIEVEVLDVDGDGSTEDLDCDDGDPDNFPGNVEYCDGLDNDCTGLADDPIDFTDYYDDVDMDGWGDPTTLQSLCDGTVPPGTVLQGMDCDDGDPAIFPGAVEFCDTIDNDCSGTVDDNLVFVDFWPDTDADGFGDVNAINSVCDGTVPADHVLNDLDCDDTDPDVRPGGIEYCDSIDNDCNGSVDDDVVQRVAYTDADGDTFGDPLSEVLYCEETEPPGTVFDRTDCDDDNADSYPGAPELCDLLDNNCDGTVDEGLTVVTVFPDLDGDGFGDGGVPTPACDGDEPGGFVGDNTDCDDADRLRFPGNEELCDGIDNDCDTLAGGEGDFDDDGFLDCEDCASDDPTTYPGALEVCDGIDHDCDGVIPERLDCDPAPDEVVSIITGCGCDTPATAPGVLLLLLPLWVRRRR